MTRIQAHHGDDHVTLDATTQRNLELTETMQATATARCSRLSTTPKPARAVASSKSGSSARDARSRSSSAGRSQSTPSPRPHSHATKYRTNSERRTIWRDWHRRRATAALMRGICAQQRRRSASSPHSRRRLLESRPHGVTAFGNRRPPGSRGRPRVTRDARRGHCRRSAVDGHAGRTLPARLRPRP